MQQKTILGVTLRRRIITTVNGMGRGERINVVFKGTRAYTNGKTIVLPAIRDLAEIPYSTARALIGYAIHEVSHVRFTDFEAIIRAIEAGKMTSDALIKKFENAIEDYRIERKISREFPGSASDLEALRNLIHPPLKKLKPGWLADPRACGPLALTWTGSLLNGFRVTEVQTTLDALPAPVRTLINNWTVRMTNVASTEEVVDLAIVFAKEAMDYADMSRPQPQPNSSNDQTQPDQLGDQDQQDEPNQSPHDQDQGGDEKQDEGEDQPDNVNDGGENSTNSDDNPANDGAPGNGTAPAESNATQADQDGEGGERSDTDTPSSNSFDGQPGEKSDQQPQGDVTSANEGGSSSDQIENSDSPVGEGQNNGVDDIDFNSSSSTNGRGQPDPAGNENNDQSGSIDINDGMADEYDDGTTSDFPERKSSDGAQASNEDSDTTDTDQTPETDGSSINGSDSGADRNTSFDPSDMSDALNDQLNQSSEATDETGDANDDDVDSDPFADVLEKDAEMDDILSDLREIISQTPLPESPPEATDGEVDPNQVLKNVKAANNAAPDFQSPDPDPNSEKSDREGDGASKNEYHDSRFFPIDEVGEDNQFEILRSAAAGVIATTARTIRRLLMAEEQRGVLRNKRAGQFDIRNISAIVRNTGSCYKKKWEKPAPKTHLMLLTDFSGSMAMGPSDAWSDPMASKQTRLSLAMTGALAIEEATHNTQIETSLYGYSGYSPEVQLCVFKDGHQRRITTRRKIGSYLGVDKGCTPTAEAMIAVADILDHMTENRRILVVLTDGDADDMPLCSAVVPVLLRRGIEVVAIGIMKDSVKHWCPDHYVINDIAELPTALLSIIDPRGHKKLRKAA